VVVAVATGVVVLAEKLMHLVVAVTQQELLQLHLDNLLR
jgi:hypothetical protein